MRLALDTSSIACSVAMRSGEEVIERHEEQSREHTRLLMPMICSVLEEADVSIEELDAIVLGNGPGSFIGMRIAASVAQGLAHGAGIDIVPVSSLAAVAAEVLASTDVAYVAVAQDAHMNEVYLGLYSRGANDLPEPIVDERLQNCAVIDELSLANSGFTFAGQGWQRYPDIAAMNQDWRNAESGILYPKARYLLPLAENALSVSPKDIQPAYLRHKVAEKPSPRVS